MEQGNGHVTWRDLENVNSRARAEHHESYRHLSAKIDKLATRVGQLESVIDQQRGAKNLVYALIGSNLLLVAVSLFTILSLTGFFT